MERTEKAKREEIVVECKGGPARSEEINSYVRHIFSSIADGLQLPSRLIFFSSLD